MIARVLSKAGPVIGLAFVFCIFAVLKPSTFLTVGNMQLMLLQTAVVGTAALGMTLIIISGGIDLSVGSNIALCTVVLGVVVDALTPGGSSAAEAGAWRPLVAAAAGIAASAVVGLAIGVLVTKAKLAPFIVTLGFWGAVRGMAEGVAQETTVRAPDTWLSDLLSQPTGSMQWMVLAPGVWMTLILAALTAAVLRYTRFGRHVFAVGSNEQTARLCGVGVGRVKMGVYLLGGIAAGVAGVLQFGYLSVGDPTTAMGKELDVIAAVVIGGASLTGGRGSIAGSLVGALVMTVVDDGCTKMGLSNWVQQIVTGAIILMAVSVDRLRRSAD
jgi:ribose transport system permease protein